MQSFCPPKISFQALLAHQFIPTSYKGFQKVLLPSFGYLHVLNQTSGKIPSGAHPHTGDQPLPSLSFPTTFLKSLGAKHPCLVSNRNTLKTWLGLNICIFSKKWVSICNINNHTYTQNKFWDSTSWGQINIRWTLQSMTDGLHDVSTNSTSSFSSMHPSEQ